MESLSKELLWSLVVNIVIIWICIQATDGQECNFGRDCKFPCHCLNNDTCDSKTGDCPNGCAENNPPPPAGLSWSSYWMGPACQIGNLLVTTKNSGDAVAVVDGDLSSCLDVGSYFRRQNGEDSYVFINFTVKMHSNTGNKLWDVYFGIGSTDDIHDLKTCAHIKRGDIDHNLETQIIQKTCDRPLLGSVFYLWAPNKTMSLEICEIIVSGYYYQACTEGLWGPGCLKTCNCEGICDDVTGVCPTKCLPGWAGSECQTECPDFRWGVNCIKRCLCNNLAEVCNKKDGSCISGCALGLSGPGCTRYTEPRTENQECPDFRWGANCMERCLCNNLAEVCNKTDGSCESGCAPGLSGPGCTRYTETRTENQECPDFRWGPNCMERCLCKNSAEVCSKIDGSCESGCAPGLSGPGCTRYTDPRRESQECPDFRWGPNCKERCACQNFGEVCNKTDGSCISGCASGLSGPGCTKYDETRTENLGYLPIITLAGLSALLFVIIKFMLMYLCIRLNHGLKPETSVARKGDINMQVVKEPNEYATVACYESLNFQTSSNI